MENPMSFIQGHLFPSWKHSMLKKILKASFLPKWHFKKKNSSQIPGFPGIKHQHNVFSSQHCKVDQIYNHSANPNKRNLKS